MFLDSLVFLKRGMLLWIALIVIDAAVGETKGIVERLRND